MRKAIILDLDGTLIDSRCAVLASFRHAWQREVGLPIDDSKVLIGLPLEDIYEDVGGKDSSWPAFLNAFRCHYNNECVSSQAYPHVFTTMTILASKGVSLHCATFKPKAQTLKMLSATGLGNIFATVVTVDSRAEHYTSKAEMISFIMSKHSLRPTDCLFVGDTKYDMDGAERCNMDFVLAAYGYGNVTHKNYINDFMDVLRFV